MSSKRRIESSRANGARSRGPKTPEGFARASDASLTHGLSARRIVLANESEDEFRALRDAYIAGLRPADELELSLIDRMVAARWRLFRIWSLEAAFLNLETLRQAPAVNRELEDCDSNTRTALAFRALVEASGPLQGLNRYEARYTRAYDRASNALAALRAGTARNANRRRANPAPSSVSQTGLRLPTGVHPPSPAAKMSFSRFQKLQHEPSPANEHPPLPPAPHPVRPAAPPIIKVVQHPGE